MHPVEKQFRKELREALLKILRKPSKTHRETANRIIRYLLKED